MSARLPDGYEVDVPGTTEKIAMVPVAALPGRGRGFWMATTETTWDLYDVFVFEFDTRDGAAKLDGVSRPSKPYIPPDHGYGHEGFAAMCVTFKSAREFCRWLSGRTGHTYRLPTADEWEHACRAGATTKYPFGDDASALSDHAWFEDNCDEQTQAVGKKLPNAWGLHDMLGNVQEWCVTKDDQPITCGASYVSTADEVSPSFRAEQTYEWNETDPQIPKSEWWLSDGSFVGFRVVRDFDR